MLQKMAAYFLSAFLLLCMAIEGNAATACFTPSAVKGCVPFTLTLDPSCAVYNPAIVTPQYNYDFLTNPGGANFTTSTTHTFTTPGTYRVLQFIGNLATQYFVDVLVVAAPDPVFTVKTCSGRSVDVVITDPVYDQFDINWGDGSPVQTVLPATTTNHIYTSDGSKSITVSGIFLPNSNCKSKTVTTYAIQTLSKPDLTQIQVMAQHTSAGQVVLTYTSKTGQTYRIDRSTNGGAYTTINPAPLSGNGIVFYSDQNLNTQANVYTYQVTTYDDCGLTISSDPIYSIIIKATATNALNTVTWNTDPAVSSFSLTKNSIAQTFPAATTSFADNAIACGSSYCYSNTASLTTLTFSGTPQKSISIDTCITAISTTIPPAVQDVNSTMNGSTATLSWTSAGSGISHKIYQSVNASAYTQIAQQTGTSYPVALPNLTSSYCYQLDYSDLCANASPRSATTCPVILQGAIAGTTITLNWNAYSGYNNTGIQSYAVQKLDQNGTVLSETNVGLLLNYSETVNLNDPYINYRIKVYPTNSAFANSYSNNSLFKFEAEVFVPDIFTPNGDGTNDYLLVKGRYVNTYSITIFSRWGEVVYASTDMSVGWSGSNNFVYAPDGAYTYKIIATDINNKEFIKTGTVTLTR